jgi:hypothetical protein
MRTGSLSAAQWRERAEEARAKSEQMSHQRARALMLQVAIGYEQLALHAEAVERAAQSLKNPN